MSQIIDHSHEDEVMKAVEETIIDAEFKILTESNEECAMSESGLSILFKNWAGQ